MIRKLQIALGVIQAFVALGALPAGFSMIVQPDGSGLGMTTKFLLESPFTNFFIPGLFLFFVNGLANLTVSILTFRRNKHSGRLGLILGFMLVGWIAIQVWSTGYISFMQPLFFGIGLAEIILAYLILKNSGPE
ncbi:MAG: hypothetical protein HOO86_05605 [Bacteroidales bacterium]|nr:hypothetical protein [Bacteroidales bacterium]